MKIVEKIGPIFSEIGSLAIEKFGDLLTQDGDGDVFVNFSAEEDDLRRNYFEFVQ